MYNLRHKQTLIFLIFIAVFAFFVLTDAKAFIRPANPVMDYVPQNVGIYDTYYENFKEPDCRACHGASTAERHHGTERALSGDCQFCHFGSVPSELETDCKACHIDAGHVGDFGNPHHKTDLADSCQCNQCHLNVVETNTVEPPLYAPTSITPTPYSCENCHWPSGNRRHKPPKYSDWQSWTGFPKPTFTDGIEDPQPIEANGPVSQGTLGERPYRPVEGTHHEIHGKIYYKCYLCHASSPGSSASWDPDNPYLIRFCENCHSKDMLHSIREHVTENDIYTVGGVSNQLVTSNQKCMACHGYDLSTLPQLPADIPLIDHLEPNFGPPGIIVDIIPASGCCWNEDPVNGLCSFGLKMNGDTVKMGQRDVTGNWYWIDAPIYSWSEHLIQIYVPGWPFHPGKTRVEVYKENVGTSPFKVFNVREYPAIYSFTPSAGNWGQIVNISGAGFSVTQEKVYRNGYGYSTYVELHTLTHEYRVTAYLTPSDWYPDNIPIRLETLLNIKTENPVYEQDLYTGCWNLMVITDYFMDDGDGKYNYSLSGLDTSDNAQGSGMGDELLYRAISNPVCFTVTKDPYINGISPNPAPYADTAEIYGSNFGTTQGSSVVKVWNSKKTNFKTARIRAWSNTKIKFVVPRFGINPARYPKKTYVQVVVPGKPESNDYKLTIIAPGP